MPANLDTEQRTRDQNDGDGNRLGDATAGLVLRMARSWITRQALKLAAATSTAVCAYLIGQFHISDDTAAAIGAGAAAVLTGILEITLSYINTKLAPKALPVDEDNPQP